MKKKSTELVVRDPAPVVDEMIAEAIRDYRAHVAAADVALDNLKTANAAYEEAGAAVERANEALGASRVRLLVAVGKSGD